MKRFKYRAKNEKRPEDVLDGIMMAERCEDVVDNLARQGYIATLVKEDMTVNTPTGAREMRLKAPKLTFRGHALLARQLASLLRSGIPILRAFGIISDEAEYRNMHFVLTDIARRIQNGDTLAQGLARYPKLFSPFYIAMVRSGEESGTLVESLDRLSKYYTSQAEFTVKIRSALAYPSLIFLVGILTVIFVFTNVIPKIAPLFKDLNVELPLPTRILLSVSSLFEAHWLGIILGLSIFLLISFRAFKTHAFRRYVSLVALKVPVLGPFLIKSEFARFARTFEIAMHSGIPIINAMALSIDILKLDILREGLIKVKHGLEGGKLLGEQLKGLHLFPSLVYTVISIGEESGRLEEALGDISSTFEDDCEETVRFVTTLLEPVMVLAVGLVVAFIVGAVLLPIFQLNVINI